MDKFNLNEDEFIGSVIDISKDVFDTKDQQYVTKTRINKLSILVANELQKVNINIEGFVWGYYRHGFYSPNVNKYISFNYGGEFNLRNVDKVGVDVSKNLYSFIFDVIKQYKKFFVKDHNQFPKWIYSEKTPMEYQSFYKSHMALSQWFEDITMDLRKGFQKNLFGRNDRGITNLISNYYYSLWFVEDDETLILFRKFTDLVEDLALKFNNEYNPKKIEFYLLKLNKLYNYKKKASILNLLTPYLNTIKGDPQAIPFAIKHHQNKVSGFKKEINKKLDEIYFEFEKEGLLPTFEEMDKELEEFISQSPPGTKNLDEIYDILLLKNHYNQSK